MPRPAADQEAVREGRLTIADIYTNARYDAGYRMGWRDAHRMKRPAHRATRRNYEEYATAYAHGWDDGSVHPCPEWDEAHRTRGELPPGCPW